MVFSHLQQVNIISVFTKIFSKKNYIFRQHSVTNGADYTLNQTLLTK